ncbi:endonuclease/exonuclease/phosphatase family protein [Aeromonas veronii]|uniref:endonuclease/exonuclease/phosphatase family protein n=1 Tax=Aeromonas veronii TaxID=654 RepID=UPI003D1A6F75
MNKLYSLFFIGALTLPLCANAQDGRANNNQNSREVASAMNGLPNKVFAQNKGPSITVATFNIGAAKVSNISSIAAAIKTSSADIVALQEVDQLTKRSGNIDHLAELKKLTGMNGVFGAAIDFDGGKYGLAFLSKYPIKTKEIVQLPSGNREQRIALITEVSVPGFPATITAINTHLDTKENPEIRIGQIQELNDRTIEIRGIKVLMGDFNDTPETTSIKEVTKYWNSITPLNREHRTWPANNPEIGVDYIFTSNAQRWNIKNVTIPAKTGVYAGINWPTVSDHLPIMATLQLTEQ